MLIRHCRASLIVGSDAFRGAGLCWASAVSAMEKTGILPGKVREIARGKSGNFFQTTGKSQGKVRENEVQASVDTLKRKLNLC